MLSELPKFEELGFRHTRLTDINLARMETELPGHIKELNLLACHGFTDEEVAALRKARPDLMVVVPSD